MISVEIWASTKGGEGSHLRSTSFILTRFEVSLEKQEMLEYPFRILHSAGNISRVWLFDKGEQSARPWVHNTFSLPHLSLIPENRAQHAIILISPISARQTPLLYSFIYCYWCSGFAPQLKHVLNHRKHMWCGAGEGNVVTKEMLKRMPGTCKFWALMVRR